MNQSHTPGPWSIFNTRFPDGRDGFTVNGNDERGNRNIPVAEIPEWFFSNLGTKDQHLANARLIAAAPELLAALEALLDTDCPNKQYVAGHPFSAKARAAIAVARGSEFAYAKGPHEHQPDARELAEYAARDERGGNGL